jgi:UDP-N-acetylglucosamine 2-epimerase
MLAVATAATIMRIPIVHIAGGEISEGAFDDSIRHAITKLSSLHLTATEPYRQRVISMGENEDLVINTGAIGVWNIANETPMSKTELER